MDRPTDRWIHGWMNDGWPNMSGGIDFQADGWMNK